MTIALEQPASGVEFSADGTVAHLLLGSDVLLRVRTADFTLSGPLARQRGSDPEVSTAATTSDGRKAFIPTKDRQSLSVVDLWNNEERATVEVGHTVGDGTVLPGDLQYATVLRDEHRVALIGVGTHEIEGEIIDGIGQAPHSIITSHDGTLAFVNNKDSNDVSVIELSTQSVISRIPTGAEPTAIAVDPSGRQLWVCCRGSRELQVFLLPDRTPAARPEQMPRTEVAVLGMTHRRHRTSDTWNLQHVEQTIRNYRPEVICVEIPPNRWLKTATDYAERSVVEDTRARVFPEYTDVVMPLTKSDDLGGTFIIEPCAGWTHEMNALRRARIAEFENDERFAKAAAAYARDSASAREATAAVTDTDDPRVIHSSEYDEATRQRYEPYDRYLNHHIGPGGWTNINQAHWDLIEAAIRRHPGKRVLVTFGAGHKYWILDQLRKLPWVEIVDVEEYLPEPSK